MSYTSTAVATRPEGVQWFSEAYPTKSRNEFRWIKSQPGFVSFTVTNQNTNTLVSALVFDSAASFEAMDAARLTRTDWIARQVYCDENGITKSVVRG